MLRKFKVENFKQFKSLEFDFSKTRKYDFSSDCIVSTMRGDLVKTALVYGKNASGKTNLGLAIFDIVQHLVDKVTNPGLYSYYLNADNPDQPAKFWYDFSFGEHDIEYSYSKISSKSLVAESLKINGDLVFEWDSDKNSQNLDNLKKYGFENMNLLYRDPKLSFLRYLTNNASLESNSPFRLLMDFVGSMIWFRRTDEGNNFMGYDSVATSLDDFIISNHLVKEFEDFLTKHEVNEHIKESKDSDGRKRLYFDHKQAIPFFSEASSGTLALTVLFFWSHAHKLNKASFIFMDEYDVFFHYEVSMKAYKLAKDLEIQCVITTHNTNLLNHNITRPDCCFLINNETIRSFADTTGREIRQGNNLEKLYLSHEFV